MLFAKTFVITPDHRSLTRRYFTEVFSMTVTLAGGRGASVIELDALE